MLLLYPAAVANHGALVVTSVVEHEDLLQPVQSGFEIRQISELPRREVSAEASLDAKDPGVWVAVVKDNSCFGICFDELADSILAYKYLLDSNGIGAITTTK